MVRRWLARWGRVIAVAVIAFCWLAVFGGIALMSVDPGEGWTGVIIAGAAAAVIFGALIWLGRRGQ